MCKFSFDLKFVEFRNKTRRTTTWKHLYRSNMFHCFDKEKNSTCGRFQYKKSSHDKCASGKCNICLGIKPGKLSLDERRK